MNPRTLHPLAAVVVLLALGARAQGVTPPELVPDELRQAESLIAALAQRGMLPRARADEMLREGRLRAGLPPPATGRAAALFPRGEAATREALRAQIRAEVTAEVRAEVRDEVLSSARALMAKASSGAPLARAQPSPMLQPLGPAASVPAAPTPTAMAANAVAATQGPAPTLSPMPAQAQAPTTAPAVAPTPAASPAPTPAPVTAANNVVRVPYVPKPVRDAIRNEIKEEIIAQARAEQWGAPAAGGATAAAEWTDRLKIEGDLRVRHQRDAYGKDNPAPEDFLLASLNGSTRAADLAAGTAAGLPLANTEDDRSRLRLRARLAFSAKISDSVSAGLRLATGSASDRVSTNQTLGQNGNRYQFLLDRAFIRMEPLNGLSVSAGRIPNPWFATDLQWSENLNFEGIAGTWRWPAVGARTIEPFITAGWFPLRESAPPRSGRSLTGAQAGVQWEGGRTRLRVGLAQYTYHHLEGRVDGDYDATLGAGRSYGQFEYEAGLRQRGNTLFLTNNQAEATRFASGVTPDLFRWGLASKFAPRALTVAAELSHFAPVVVLLSGEVVKNAAFDRAEILARTGLQVSDGSDAGFSLRATVGAAEVRERGQWQAQVAYRKVGSDAVLDAFTDGDLGLGGTNLSGFSAGFVYGVDRNVNLGVRYLSAKQLDSMAVQPVGKNKYAIDSLQVDLNARF